MVRDGTDVVVEDGLDEVVSAVPNMHEVALSHSSQLRQFDCWRRLATATFNRWRGRMRVAEGLLVQIDARNGVSNG